MAPWSNLVLSDVSGLILAWCFALIVLNIISLQVTEWFFFGHVCLGLKCSLVWISISFAWFEDSAAII